MFEQQQAATTLPTIFTFNELEIREITDAHGEPWFVARDVCDILDLEHISNALAKIPEQHLTVIRLQSGGQIREMKAVDEAGLYRLVLRCDKPQAEPFMEFVTAEVLPSIRKTGSYAAPGIRATADNPALDRLLGVVASLATVVARIESGLVEKAIERSCGGAPARISYDTLQLKMFVGAECLEGPAEVTRQTELHGRYQAWCRERGLAAYGYQSFIKALAQTYPALRPGALRLPGARRQAPVLHGLGLRPLAEV